MVELPFRDRAEAGRVLAAELASRKLPANTIVLALPRGGVPIGEEVASALNAPLDVVIVRKIGVPWQPELAMGAIAGTTRLVDRELVHSLHIPDDAVETIIAREMNEAERRENLYRSGRPQPVLRARTVVLVDDGLATGSTMLAAARYVRSSHPARLLLAVPVASVEACSRLRKEVDECICLATPRPFLAVGQWYEDFSPVEDAEVQQILNRSHSPTKLAS